MVKRTVADLKPYDAAGHFKMVAMRIHGKEETGAQKFWIGVSTFLPRGGAGGVTGRGPTKDAPFPQMPRRP